MRSVTVKIKHTRAVGYCSIGIRRWLRGKNYSWSEFVEYGVSSSWLRETGDAMAIHVAEFAENKELQE